MILNGSGSGSSTLNAPATGGGTVTLPAGSVGIVAGPASAVSGHIATFSGTSGQIIQDGGAAGTGTVTSVATGSCLTGGPITSTGTISGTFIVNAQTGTSYTVLSTDACKLVTFSNGSAIAVTLPQATGSFAAGFSFDVQNFLVLAWSRLRRPLQRSTARRLRPGDEPGLHHRFRRDELPSFRLHGFGRNRHRHLDHGWRWPFGRHDHGLGYDSPDQSRQRPGRYVLHHPVIGFGEVATFSNGSAIAVTLPQATGSFTTGFFFKVQNSVPDPRQSRPRPRPLTGLRI